ncbi:hypothetical protein BOTBODRAFT_315745 [Botryobasidium botryosum FD-172 SS1]|uniref:Uncharacterized protein n=1 Tax=Botryobasidium botryosum (strain FD-172 SS1) TaxID=930990 RepID=A0A067N979_BOTB1|nr:hypothetical protein BOTBODRAFT_315745 [Botryobasidium botryosum FD-172 SS1]
MTRQLYLASHRFSTCRRHIDALLWQGQRNLDILSHVTTASYGPSRLAAARVYFPTTLRPTETDCSFRGGQPIHLLKVNLTAGGRGVRECVIESRHQACSPPAFLICLDRQRFPRVTSLTGNIWVQFQRSPERLKKPIDRQKNITFIRLSKVVKSLLFPRISPPLTHSSAFPDNFPTSLVVARSLLNVEHPRGLHH